MTKKVLGSKWKENTNSTLMGGVVDDTLQEFIDKKMVEDDLKRQEDHVSSGKLSASMLGYPLQWQVLKTLKAPKKPFDGHTLRKFLRGNQVEDWLTTNTPGLLDKQVLCEYRGALGYLDMLVDQSEFYKFKSPRVPHEIKSITSENFKWISRTKQPKDGHALQGAFYALSLECEYFNIDYVAADDLRIKSFLLKTSDYKNRVDTIIDTYHQQLENKSIPVFVPFESWQKNPKYNMYPDWSDLNENEIAKKMERMNLSF